MAVGAPLLEVRNLRKRFGGVVAVADLDIAVNSGEVVGLIGPNGAGKTTVLNLITGFVRPDRGSVRLDGRDVTRYPTHRLVRLGLVRTFQAASLYPGLSVMESVLTALQARVGSGLVARVLAGPLLGRRSELTEKASEILGMTGLGELADLGATTLPYGQQRLLGLAMALALSPNVLLLDEPASGMAQEERNDLIALIGRLKEQGKTMLLIEHDVALVATVCDRVVVVNYGRKISQGTPTEVQSDPEVIEAYLGTPEP